MTDEPTPTPTPATVVGQVGEWLGKFGLPTVLSLALLAILYLIVSPLFDVFTEHVKTLDAQLPANTKAVEGLGAEVNAMRLEVEAMRDQLKEDRR